MTIQRHHNTLIWTCALLAVGMIAGCSLIVAEERTGEGICGDGVRSGDEECDGTDFAGRDCVFYNGPASVGTLYCNQCVIESHDCSNGAVCGNGHCEASETDITCPNDCWLSSCGMNGCEAHENSDTCPQDCFEPTECGNGEVEVGEECDSGDLAGWTCESLGYDNGQLHCDLSCRIDASDCISNRLADGAPCAEGYLCAGDICWRPMVNGWDMTAGYCSGECPLDICSGGGACLPNGPAGPEPYCYDLCINNDDCRPTHSCWAPVSGMPDICWPM